MKVIYVDIDETICNRESSTDFGTTHDYTKAKPIQNNIDKINQLYDQGNTIVSDWGCKYHELRVDKPFYDLFIEDKSLRIEEV